MADMKQAKCPNCGATLPVDPKKEATICSYCGSPFITEKAINTLNINNGTINVTNNKPKENIWSAMKTYIEHQPSLEEKKYQMKMALIWFGIMIAIMIVGGILIKMSLPY